MGFWQWAFGRGVLDLVSFWLWAFGFGGLLVVGFWWWAFGGEHIFGGQIALLRFVNLVTEVHSALLYAYVGILIVSIFFSAPDKDLVEIGKKFWVSAY